MLSNYSAVFALEQVINSKLDTNFIGKNLFNPNSVLPLFIVTGLSSLLCVDLTIPALTSSSVANLSSGIVLKKKVTAAVASFDLS